jgi:hypothetical protein
MRTMELDFVNQNPNDDDEFSFPTIPHPLASVLWPTTCKLWNKQVTAADINEILDILSIADNLKGTVRNFAIKILLHESNGKVDEEELIQRLSAFVDGLSVASHKRNVG